MPVELQLPMKGLIDIKNYDDKCFKWCHVRHLNNVDKNPERIRKEDREFFKKLNYQGVDFSVSKKSYSKIEILNTTGVNVLYYENKVVYPVYISNQKFDYCLDLFLISNIFTSYYVYIKDFNKLMFNKTKHEGRKYFCKSSLQCFSSEKVLKEHKEDCLMINGKQNVKLGCSREIPVLFKIYADFESVLKNCDVGIDSQCFSYTKKYQDLVLCGFAYKVVCIDDKYSKDIVLYRGKTAVFKFIDMILKEYGYCRKVINKYFCKKLVMTAEKNEEFERFNICWICGKLIDFD